MDKTQLIDCKDSFCYFDLECMESSLNSQQMLIENEIQNLNDRLERVQKTRERVRNTMQNYIKTSNSKGKQGELKDG